MAGNLRSSRKRALEIGTDSSKFHNDLPYDHNAGVPASEAQGEYKDSAEGAASPQSGGAPDPSPFANLRDG